MKKGISLVILVITVIIVVILTGIVVLNMSGILINTDKAKLQIDISQLEALMSTYKTRNNGEIDFTSTLFDTSGLSEEELNQFGGEIIVGNKVLLYIIDIEKIDGETPNFGNLQQGNTDRYLYSLTTGKVYYEYGLETDEMTYYHIEDGEIKK